MPEGQPSHDHGDLVPPSSAFADRAHVNGRAARDALAAEEAKDPVAFWMREAQSLTWVRPPTKGLDWEFETPRVRWFEDGLINVSSNCLDRHVAAGHGARTAIIWEGDDPREQRRISYAELLQEVCRAANALKVLGVERGDRVCLYMPMVPEAAIAMLACTRIGAVHSVVFGGFSAESLSDRINDSACKVLITADQGLRGGKVVPLKEIAEAALARTPSIQHVLVVRRTGAQVPFVAGRDHWWHDVVNAAPAECPPAAMGAEDPLFILYTSGSTGKPKGVLHTTAGYLLWAAWTHRMVFDWRPDDIYWCTADVGWVTGHTYIVYGPLANGATTLMFEGVPTYPDAGRFWDVVDRHQVTIFYTAPTAIRGIAQHGD